MKFIRNLFLGKDLSDIVNATKVVKVHGVRFTIKKADPLSFLDGSKVMLQEFDTYKLKKVEDLPSITEGVLRKMKEHYIDVLMAGVVSPKLVRKKEDAVGSAIFVDHLFTEWDLAQELYVAVVEFTYGKKKFKLDLYPEKSL